MTLDVTTRKAMETKNVELRAEVAEAETAVDCAIARLDKLRAEVAEAEILRCG